MYRSTLRMLVWGCFFGLFASLLSACGAAVLPAEQYSEARQTIRAVTKLGAADNPRAKLHLMLAQDELENADKYLAQNSQEKARLAFMRAEADAALALAILEHEQAEAEVEALKRELERRGEAPASTARPGEE